MAALMGRLATELRHVDDELAAQIRRYHLVRQLRTLAVGVVVSIVGTLTAGGPGPFDWKTLGPLLAAAIWTQLAKQAPAVPWGMLRVRLGLSAGAAAAPPGGSPGGGGGQ